MASIYELKNTTTNVLNDYLFPVISKMVVEYYIDSVPLVFHSYVPNMDHAPDVICYKAVEVSEWNECLDAYKQDPRCHSARVSFRFDCMEHEVSIGDLMNSIKVSSDPKLKQALEMIYPKYIGSDIDVYDTLKCALLGTEYPDALTCDIREWTHEEHNLNASTQWLSNEPCKKLIG